VSYFRSLALVAAVSLAAPALADGIEVHDAYAIASRPDAPSGAAFMVIRNDGGPPDRLIAVRSGVAARTELHTHIQGADGMMQMVHVTEGWALPTDGEILLARGGNHVMLMGIAEPFVDGEELALTLIFEVAGEVNVVVPVDLSRLGGGPMDPGQMDHGEMNHGEMNHGEMNHGEMNHDEMNHGEMDHGTGGHGTADHGTGG